MLGLIGAVVGLYFGISGTVKGLKAASAANRKGGDSASLFRADRLASALDKVRANVGADARLLKLVVYPGYLIVEASTGSEREGRAFKLQSDGRVHNMPLTLTGPGRLEDNTFALAKLDGGAVERLTNAVAAKENATLDDITHLVATIDPVSGKPGFGVHLKNSRMWRAALDGSALTNPDLDARKALEGAADAVDSAASRSNGAARAADDLAACVQAAGTDVAKIQACTG